MEETARADGADGRLKEASIRAERADWGWFCGSLTLYRWFVAVLVPRFTISEIEWVGLGMGQCWSGGGVL